MPSIIRGIAHYDFKSPNNGPELIVLNGGVGYKYATIKLQSQRGSGINSLLQVFL